jgi:hypothetical protein
MPYKGSITLDLDSSIFPFYGNKEGADWTYDGQWGYHPLFAFIGETSECLHLWLRRGNTYSGKDSPRFLKESLGILSRSIRRIKVRGDSAFYSSNFVQECESRNVDFTVTADQTAPLIERVKALPQESWRAFGEEEIAEFRYQPAGWDKSYRYIVMREKYKASEQIGLFSGGYKYQILVTSMKGCAEGLMQFHRKRATIENCIKEMKNGFSLEHIPTGKFHANWVYLLIGKLAYNLSIWLKYIAFPFKYRRMSIKRLRFWFFSVAGYIIKRGRQIILRIYSKDENWFKVFTEASIIIKSLEFR